MSIRVAVIGAGIMGRDHAEFSPRICRVRYCRSFAMVLRIGRGVSPTQLGRLMSQPIPVIEMSPRPDLYTG